MKCPVCQGENIKIEYGLTIRVDSDSYSKVFCFECGNHWLITLREIPEPPAIKPKNKGVRRWWLAVALVSLLIIGVPVIKGLAGGSYYAAETPHANKYEVITASQSIVKDYLVSPTSADFPWGTDEYNITENGFRYLVKGYVDSDNAFGANIRNEYITVFEYSKDYQDYTALYLKIGDQTLFGGDTE